MHSLATEKFEIRVMALSGFSVCFEVGVKSETGNTGKNGNQSNWKPRFLTTANLLYLAPYISRGHIPEMPRQRNVEFDIFIFDGGTVVSI